MVLITAHEEDDEEQREEKREGIPWSLEHSHDGGADTIDQKSRVLPFPFRVDSLISHHALGGRKGGINNAAPSLFKRLDQAVSRFGFRGCGGAHRRGSKSAETAT